MLRKLFDGFDVEMDLMWFWR